MKRFRLSLLAATLTAAGFSASPSQAAISITNFTLTPNSVSFTISGTLPSPAPGYGLNALFFVNPNPTASPGFALGSFFLSNSSSFTGAQILRSSIPVATGGTGYGDYFFVAFQNNLSVAETLSGVLTATWTGTAFDPGAVTSLNVFWGAADSATITTGTFLTSVSVLAAVPEPSTATLLGAAGLSLGLIRRRRA